MGYSRCPESARAEREWRSRTIRAPEVGVRLPVRRRRVRRGLLALASYASLRRDGCQGAKMKNPIAVCASRIPSSTVDRNACVCPLMVLRPTASPRLLMPSASLVSTLVPPSAPRSMGIRLICSRRIPRGALRGALAYRRRLRSSGEPTGSEGLGPYLKISSPLGGWLDTGRESLVVGLGHCSIVMRRDQRPSVRYWRSTFRTPDGRLRAT